MKLCLFGLALALLPCIGNAEPAQKDHVVATVGSVPVTAAAATSDESFLSAVLRPLLEAYAVEHRIVVTQQELEIAAERVREESLSFDKSREFLRKLIVGARTDQALYKRFRGRVKWTKTGPVPVDAYRDLIDEKVRDGTLRILAEADQSRFDRALESMAAGAREPAGREVELMVSPWWLMADPEPPAVPARITRDSIVIGNNEIEVAGPGQGDWIQITAAPDDTVWLVWKNRTSGISYSVRSTKPGRKTIESLAATALSEARSIASRQKAEIKSVTSTRAEIPRSGSLKYGYVRTLEGTSPQATFGYITSTRAGILLQIETTCECRTEPEPFKAFAREFSEPVPR